MPCCLAEIVRCPRLQIASECIFATDFVGFPCHPTCPGSRNFPLTPVFQDSRASINIAYGITKECKRLGVERSGACPHGSESKDRFHPLWLQSRGPQSGLAAH